MAIDTEAKRRSVMAISTYFISPSLKADGVIATTDRQVIGYGYFGALEFVVTEVDVVLFVVPAEPLFAVVADETMFTVPTDQVMFVVEDET